jgi:hypothetical protein
MGPVGDKPEKLLGVEKLATDGSNWPLWRATLQSYFESKNLLKHIEGTAVKPHDPPTFAVGYTPTEDEEAKWRRLRRGWKNTLLEKGKSKPRL